MVASIISNTTFTVTLNAFLAVCWSFSLPKSLPFFCSHPPSSLLEPYHVTLTSIGVNLDKLMHSEEDLQVFYPNPPKCHIHICCSTLPAYRTVPKSTIVAAFAVQLVKMPVGQLLSMPCSIMLLA